MVDIKYNLNNMRVLTIIKENSKSSCSYVSKKVDMFYPHTLNLINQFIKDGIIEFKKYGRTKVLSLTKKGEKIEEHFNQINKLMRSK